MTGSIEKLLIANRGEIASRVVRTARRMGIATVAVFSDADEALPFVREADEAFRLGPGPADASYLSVARVLEAARVSGADAIHPGFGFLAENDAFARRVSEAGLTFVGPSPEAIAKMGKKREAKAIAEAAGVPVVPGYAGEDQRLEAFREAAERIGYPVLLKASAGGGGKGMRVARSVAELEAAFASARREAEHAFGDPTLLLERLVERPRHVEVQILGDRHGGLVHLGERECSIQRRHQKVLEEAPSPALDDALRARITDAALRLARSIGYTSAGTAEFVLAPSGDFFFLEVNTRLQVEHPVTEGVYWGIDLVEEQLRIARGEALRFTQAELDERRAGSAIEVRLCAEDPSAGFLPASGALDDFHLPPELRREPWLRVEAGVEADSSVSVHYDSMIAKLIARGADREEARARLRHALGQLFAAGIATNRRFLHALLAHPAFARGELHTGFIDEHLAGGKIEPPTSDARARAAIVAALVLVALRDAERAILPRLPSHFRSHRMGPERIELASGDVRDEIAFTPERDGRFLVRSGAIEARAELVRLERDDAPRARSIRGALTLSLDERRLRVRFAVTASSVHVHLAPETFSFARVSRLPLRAGAGGADAAVAPMPGKILEVRVEAGALVERGSVMVIMEAMKMEHGIEAPRAARVAAIHVSPGDQVEGGQLLVVLGD